MVPAHRIVNLTKEIVNKIHTTYRFVVVLLLNSNQCINKILTIFNGY